MAHASSSVQHALASFLVSAPAEPETKKPREQEGALSSEHKKLIDVLTHVIDDRMGKQAEKIDRALGVMAQATYQQFSDLRKELDTERKARKALEEEMRKEFFEIKKQASQRASSMPPFSSTSSFSPGHVRIKGWCQYSERLDEGVTRAEADEFRNKLLQKIPKEIQHHVGPIQLRGGRNYSIRIKIHQDVLQEVHSLWKDSLAAGEGDLPGKQRPYVTMERAPEVQVKYALHGKMKQFIHGKLEGDRRSIRCYWSPDFAIYDEGGGEGGDIYIGSVTDSQTIS
ncbi:unnamed protein product [Prorocentrum cordatum]|uniref:Uncharacterized protein n=1 Tax=Prorocentrum cordatum TaxID=2364126 RepID=A0ABN9TCT1_9DINO|nr:unnamed protein product [Polarella glacialis]